jgi:hypothetical protein
MMRFTVSLLLAVAFVTTTANVVFAQEYKATKVDSPAPAEAVSSEIAARLQETGFKVAKGDRVLCEMWLVKELPVAAGAQVGGEILYPLSPGELVGVARYPRKAADFREQDIPAGTYTVRYGQQPVDGAHVGTSPTRDFLLLLPAAKDRDPKSLDYKTLTGTSKDTTGTAHPAILSLQKAEGAERLSVREESEKQWTIMHFVATTAGPIKELPMELVVVGKAAE